MGVELRLKTDVKKEIDELYKKYREAVRNIFIKAGERAVRQAKSSHTYKDVTGRLTASIGYGVISDGQLVATGGFGGGEGGDKGLRLLMSLIPSKGDALIIVAGMEYALYVERKGYVVLDGGTLVIADEIERELKSIRL